MKIQDIAKLLDAKVYSSVDYLDNNVISACASDMMSDVLAYVKDQSVLISGLCNPQTIRTAVMMDMRCLVLVRGKVPTEDMVKLAESKGIVILGCKLSMYNVCGLLFNNGLMTGRCD